METQNFDETFDFIVVGSGGGSMCAALVMRSLGKKVLVLEKTNLIGGTTARSGGVMWIPNNRFMADAGVEDSYEKAMTYLDATTGQNDADAPGATRERRALYVREAPKMIDFLVSRGIKLSRVKKYPDYYDNLPGGSAPGRTVVADIFNINELPKDWASKLQPNFLPMPGTIEEFFLLPMFKKLFAAKRVAVRIALRGMRAKFTGKHWGTGGAALQGRMLQASLKAGVQFRLSAAVSPFIVENDAVKGVEARIDGRIIRYGANLGVLVNAGGFAQNQEMRDKYMPGTSAKWTATISGDTGEMLREMMKLGAQTAQMDEMVGNQFCIPPGRENQNGNGLELGLVSGMADIAKPHGILVDQTGVRYMTEGGSYMEFCQQMLARNRVAPAIPSWWVFDSEFMKYFLFCATMPGEKSKPKDWLASGWLKKADTLEELARLCKIDPAGLKVTIETFNAGARAGKDTEFHRGESEYDRFLGDPTLKPNPSLGTVEKGPFYAAPVVPGDVGTYGGVVTDTYARVLREDGSPIQGLYATGTSTASVMGRCYPGAGSSIGPSFTFGYVAAKHAANAGNLAEEPAIRKPVNA